MVLYLRIQSIVGVLIVLTVIWHVRNNRD